MLKAKAAGILGAFEPVFEANCFTATIRTPADATIQVLPEFPGVRWMGPATTTNLRQAQDRYQGWIRERLNGVAAAAQRNAAINQGRLQAYVYIGNTWVNGYTPASNQAITVTLKNASNQVKSIANTTSDYYGYYYLYFPLGTQSNIWSTDNLVFQVPGQTVTRTVPVLTASGDRNSNLVWGNAPPSSRLLLDLYHCEWISWGRACGSFQQEVTANSSGAYSYDFTPRVDVIGSDSVYARMVLYGGDFRVYRSLSVPYVNATIGYNYLWGYGMPNQGATLVLKNASGQTKATLWVASSYNGYFNGYFFDGLGRPVVIVAGDRIEASGAATGNWAAVIANLTAVPNAVADTVSGAAPPNKWVEVQLIHGWNWYYLSTKANASGVYAANFRYTVDMTRGDRGSARHQLVGGDYVERGYLVP